MTKQTGEHLLVAAAVFLGLVQTGHSFTRPHVEFPGPAPGKAEAKIRKDELILQNEVLACSWRITDGRLEPKWLADTLSQVTLALHGTECFQLLLENGRQIKASDLKIVAEPEVQHLQPNSHSCRLADKCAGKQITVKLTASDGYPDVRWQAVLRDGSNYIRRRVVFAANNKAIRIKEIVGLQLPVPHAEVAGTVDGSPVVAGNMFFACEHPLAKSQIVRKNPTTLRCSLPYRVVLSPGERFVLSCVIGVVPQGQLRRGFLYYIERQRVHPYRPFLHYNSWYDIGYGAEKIREHQFLKVIELFGKELIQRRKVSMDSFVLDDGWDDTATLWQLHDGFPNGFSRLQKAAEKYDSALGAWLSPWGGYGQAKKERMKYGSEQGFETNESGFSLAGPTYHARFRDVCVGLIRDYDLNYFKFDGIGAGGRPTGADARFAQDIEGLLRLIGELRQAKPELFINVTTGTWPSPFWLWYGDSTWRAGRDWGTLGWGSKRQQQVTYRDNETYHNVVCRAPLYPLNSLMTQGIMFANHGLANEAEGLVEDIRAFFASGTNCQELYITPSLLDSQSWDALAEAARWSRDNADVLVDTHWVGGDPAKGQVYGWASWSRRKGILALRNAKDEPGMITLDIGKVFQLPEGAPQSYSLKSPWKQDADKNAVVLSAGKEHTFELKPFEVLVFDATPR